MWGFFIYYNLALLATYAFGQSSNLGYSLQPEMLKLSILHLILSSADCQFSLNTRTVHSQTSWP